MTWSNLFKYIIIGLLVVGCLFVGIFGQLMETTNLVLVLGIVIVWLMAVLLFKPTVRTVLMFIAISSIKPGFFVFYLSLVFLILAYLVELSFMEKPRLIIPYPVLIFTLLVAGIQSIVNARVLSDGFRYFTTTILVPFITLLVISNAKSNENDLKTYSKFIVAVGFVLGFAGIILAILNPLSRIGSLWVTAMTINGFYLMAFFLAIGLMLIAEQMPGKYLMLFLAGIIFLGMLYTYTRITLVAVVFGFFLLMLKIKNLRKVVFLFALITPLVIPSSMISRIEVGITSDVSMLIRFIAWYHALIQIKENFFWGIGFSTWEHVSSSWVPYQLLYANHPHNVYLRVMVEMGIFGFLAYFGLIASILLKFYRSCVKPQQSRFDFAVFIAVVTVLFACITDVFIQQLGVSLPFWVLLGLMYKKAVMADEKAIELPYS
jgi:O-antigen ligase